MGEGACQACGVPGDGYILDIAPVTLVARSSPDGLARRLRLNHSPLRSAPLGTRKDLPIDSLDRAACKYPRTYHRTRVLLPLQATVLANKL